MVANSSRVASTDLPILASASFMTSLITVALSPRTSWAGGAGGAGRSGRAAHQRADLLTPHRPPDRARGGEVEEDHVHPVVAGHGDAGRVGDLEVAREVLVVAQLVELHRVGVGLGVGVVDP